jgi:hypothetical protein
MAGQRPTDASCPAVHARNAIFDARGQHVVQHFAPAGVDGLRVGDPAYEVPDQRLRYTGAHL